MDFNIFFDDKKNLDQKRNSLSVSVCQLLLILTLSQILFIGWSIKWQFSLSFVLLLFPAVIFWIYGWHVFLISLLSFFYWPKLNKLCQQLEYPKIWPEIAVLYTCCDDFQKESLESLLKLDYDCFHIFVLDDSENFGQRKTTKQVCSQYPLNVTYYHRKTRRGFKAGNINDGLQIVPKEYQFIAIFDADTRVPPSLLKEVIKWFQLNPRIAFVQGFNKAFSISSSQFSRNLGFTIGAFWRYGLVYKIWHGLPLNLGHNNIIKREALVDIGGVPEVSSEDIVLTYELRIHKWFGIYAPLGWAQEEYPQTLASFCTRMRRWTIQDMQTVLNYTTKIFKCKNYTNAEKYDAVMKNFKYPLSALCLPYLAAIAFVSIYYPQVFPEIGHSKFICLFVFLFLSTQAPLMLYILYIRKGLSRMICAWFALISLIFTSFCEYFFAMIDWLTNYRIEFIPTGKNVNVSQNDSSRKGNLLPSFNKFIEGCLKLSFTFLIAKAALVTDNYLLFVFAISIILGSFLKYFEWQAFWKYMHFFIGICFVIGILFALLTGINFPILLSLSILAMLYA